MTAYRRRIDRRTFLRLGALGAGTALLAPRLLGAALQAVHAADGPYGPLGLPDALGFQLPAGFSAREVAVADVAVPGTTYVWHRAPDGGATFATPGGGWIYVSNSERTGPGGGAGAIEFSSTGAVIGARQILSGTGRNCAGGATPWGTWLSCEEVPTTGLVWECDPTGVRAAEARPAMGAFNHEAAACDPVRHHVYLTEDDPAGRLRRFTPSVWGDLSAGSLEVATSSETTGAVTWSPAELGGGTAFNGGEGLWYGNDKVWFTTKGDDRVWELDVAASPQRLRVIYDDSSPPGGVLNSVDNVVGTPGGDLFVAEDGDNQELVLLTPDGGVSVFLRATGQPGSELTGPAFSPDGTRLYLSSQRGPTGTGYGVTYEVTGPFRSASTPPPSTTTTGSTTSTSTTSTTTTSTTTTSTTTTSTTVPPTTTTSSTLPATTTTTKKPRGKPPRP